MNIHFSRARQRIDKTCGQLFIIGARETQMDKPATSKVYANLEDTVKTYLRSLDGKPMLAREQEIELAEIIRSSDEQILEHLFATTTITTSLLELWQLVQAEEARITRAITGLADEQDPTPPDELRRCFALVIEEVKELFDRNTQLSRSIASP